MGPNNFSNQFCAGGYFSLDEAHLVAEVIGAPKYGHANVEFSQIESMSENSLKILLGLSLCHQNEQVFDMVTAFLGSNISPFSNYFNQARRGYSKAVLSLLELSLKASIVAGYIQ